MEERPTCRVYIEILTCRAIFYHLEDSRSHGNEREGDGAWGSNQDSSRGLRSTDIKDHG